MSRTQDYTIDTGQHTATTTITENGVFVVTLK